MITNIPTQIQQSEVELLLWSTYPQKTDLQKKRLKQLAQQTIDWSYLISLAYQHNVMPLLYRQLKANCPDLVPSELLNQLRLDFIANTSTNMALTGELLRILNLFEGQNIPVLSFKGPLLAQLAYGDLSSRQFGDLDLLIHESKVVNVHKLLLKEGYQSQCDLTDSQIRAYQKLHYGLMYWNEAKNMTIDLHWSIFPKYFSFSPTSEMIWAKLDEVNLENKKIQTLTIEILVLFLCANAAQHNWALLSLICELAHLLQKHPEIDWLLLESYLGKLGSKRMTLLSLNLIETIYGTDLPESLCQKLQSTPIITRLSTQIIEKLLSSNNQTKGFFSTCFYFQSMESWQDRLWYWINIITTPTVIEWKAIPLPAILFPLYYPIRLVRLCWKYIQKLWLFPENQ